MVLRDGLAGTPGGAAEPAPFAQVVGGTVTGPLANEFAQVRSLLMLHCDCDSAAECENTDAALAALARIEEHTHNTEKALREIEALLPVGYQAKDIARAALSAGEGTPA